VKKIVWLTLIIAFAVSWSHAYGKEPAQEYVKLSFKDKLSKGELIKFIPKIESEHNVQIRTLIHRWGEHKGWYNIPKGLSLKEALNKFELSYQNFLATRLERLNTLALLQQPRSKVFIDAKRDVERQIGVNPFSRAPK
jgi:hypothetical protein